MNYTDPFFKSVNVKRIIIDERIIELPIRYYRDRAIIGIFLALTNRIKKVLPSKRFKPIEILPELSIVSLVGLQHFDTSIGPFSELDIGIPVFLDIKFSLPLISSIIYNKYPNFGIYMYRLFVSDEKALTAGIKVWNYPKVIANINFSENEELYSMHVYKDEQTIINLILRKKYCKKKHLHSTTFFIYSIKDGEILKSPVDWKGQKYMRNFSQFVSFELGNHPWSCYISNLSLKNICIEGSYYPDLKYILNPPIEHYSLTK